MQNQPTDIIDQNKETYSEIASHFAETRKHAWKEMEDFLEYVEPGMKILDIGFGSGRTFELLKDKNIKYTGIDNAPGFVDLVNKKYGTGDGVEFLEMDMTCLDFEDENFDLIFAIASFHHIPTVELRLRTLKEMHRVLKSGGYVLMTNWNLFQKKYLGQVLRFGLAHGFLSKTYTFGDVDIPWVSKESVFLRYYHAFRLGELEKLARSAGFDVIENKLYPDKEGKSGYFVSRNTWTILQKK